MAGDGGYSSSASWFWPASAFAVGSWLFLRLNGAPTFPADYAWMWEDKGLKVPINPDDYYTVAVEANGNLTLAHRRNGQLLLFAPDHAFSGVTPAAGCPPYSLLTIDHVPNLTTWIEVCAAAWRTSD